MLNWFSLNFLAFQLKLAAPKCFSVSNGKERLKKTHAEGLLSHTAWEKQLEGKLANSRSENGVIKNRNSHYHNKTV